MLTLSVVTEADLPELMPLMRGYCDFYRVDPAIAIAIQLTQLLGNLLDFF